MNSYIEVENVTKHYTGHLALDKISINVERQSVYGLLGPNGAGKTTLIRILNQITAPDSGEIRINGERLSPKHISAIGYLPEERGLYKKMKVGEQAVYLAQLKGLDAKTARTRLKNLFDKFEISEWWDKKVEELSKGMQQKIQFITTIIHEPEILIFDEPFSGFDPINTNLLKTEILGLRDRGATILLSTHNMASVEELCDHITLINNGKNILQGSVTGIKTQFRTNTYEVIMRNAEQQTDLADNLSIVSQAQDEGLTVLTIKAQENQDSNSIIKSLLDMGEVVSFKETLPTMNDIFIRQVTENK